MQTESFIVRFAAFFIWAVLGLAGLTLPATAQARLSWQLGNATPMSASILGSGSGGETRYMSWCTPEKPGTIYTRFSGDSSRFKLGEVATMGIQGSGGSVQDKVGLTGAQNGKGAEFYLETTPASAFWRVLSTSKLVVLSAKGAPLTTLGNIDTAQISRFVKLCTPAGGGAASPAKSGSANRIPLAWQLAINKFGSVARAYSPGGQLYFSGGCLPSDPGNIFARFEGKKDGFKIGEWTLLTAKGENGSSGTSVSLDNAGGKPEFFLQDSPDSPFWKFMSSNNNVVLSAKGSVLLNMYVDAKTVSQMIDGCRLLQTQKSSANTAPQTQQPKQPAQQGSQGGNKGGNKGGGNSNVGTAIATGIIGLGAAIIANEIDKQVFTEAPPPDAPAGNNGRKIDVRIVSVDVRKTTFGLGGDEVFLIASNGQRFPAGNNGYKSVNSGDVWRPGVTFSATGGISMDLREWDSVTSSDKIGTIAVPGTQKPGRYLAKLKGDGANYHITYDVSFAGGQTAQPSRPSQPSTPASNRPNRVWGVHGTYNEITATDCRDDCEEDIGIIFMCQGPGQPARVEVPWVAVENTQTGSQRPIDIAVGGRNFHYTATMGPAGLVGHVPAFPVYPGDPLIEALSAGSVATVRFAGSGVNIGLKGSRSALSIFNAHCGWKSAAASPPQTPTQPEPQAQPYWFASQLTDSTGQLKSNLIFGIPETDATAFSASCTVGGNNANVPVDLSVDLQVNNQNLLPGTPVKAFIQTSTYTGQYSGQVFAQSSEWAGARVFVPLTDPIWQAIANERQGVTFGIGGQPTTAGADGAGQALQQFIGACRSGAQMPVPTNPAPANPTPTQPTNTANDPQTFTCDDGSGIAVSISAAGQTLIANIIESDGTRHDLIKVPSAVGNKFSNGQVSLTMTQTTAQFTTGGGSRFCVAQ